MVKCLSKDDFPTFLVNLLTLLQSGSNTLKLCYSVLWQQEEAHNVCLNLQKVVYVHLHSNTLVQEKQPAACGPDPAQEAG